MAMKKAIIVLGVVLLAVSARADVKIITMANGNEVTISYDATGEMELVRAFALDVTVTGGTIIDVKDYAIGADNGGYGIFPANFSRYITVDPQTGEVADWGVAGYTPVADANDIGSAGALGGPAITLEMGSLYDTMAPGPTGVLCTVTVSDGTTQFCVTLNDVRGGIVLEDGTQATADLSDACPGTCCGPPIPPDQRQDFDAYIDAGADPTCWLTPYQCDGDADGETEGFQKYRVGLQDLNLLIMSWQKKINDADPCADFDHRAEGFQKYRVGLQDLNILITNWKKKDAALPGDCPR